MKLDRLHIELNQELTHLPEICAMVGDTAGFIGTDGQLQTVPLAKNLRQKARARIRGHQ